MCRRGKWPQNWMESSCRLPRCKKATATKKNAKPLVVVVVPTSFCQNTPNNFPSFNYSAGAGYMNLKFVIDKIWIRCMLLQMSYAWVFIVKANIFKVNFSVLSVRFGLSIKQFGTNRICVGNISNPTYISDSFNLERTRIVFLFYFYGSSIIYVLIVSLSCSLSIPC